MDNGFDRGLAPEGGWLVFGSSQTGFLWVGGGDLGGV